MMSKVVSTRKAPEVNPEIKSDQEMANASGIAIVLKQNEEAVKKRQFEKATNAMMGFLVVKVERDHSTPLRTEYVKLINGEKMLSEDYAALRTEYQLNGFKFEGKMYKWEYGWPYDYVPQRHFKIAVNISPGLWKLKNKMFEQMETPLQIKTLDGSIYDLPNWAEAPKYNCSRTGCSIMTDTLFSALYPQFEPSTYKLVIVTDDLDEEFDITRPSLEKIKYLLRSDIPLEAMLVYKDDEE
jgi:hypothetical protein